MLSLLRPIQYTGALLDACVVSSGALVVGADAWADSIWDGALESVMPVWGVATQPVRARASAAGSASSGMPGRIRPPAAVCPVPRFLMAVAFRCSESSCSDRPPVRPKSRGGGWISSMAYGPGADAWIRPAGRNCNGNDMRPIRS